MIELIQRKDWNLEKIDFVEIKQYFSDDFIIVQIKDYQSAYSFSLGKIWIVVFIPGIGDSRYASYEVGEGFNVIQNPGITEQFKIIFQPFSKLKKVQLSIWRTDYMASFRQLLELRGSIDFLATGLSNTDQQVAALEASTTKQVDIAFGALLPATEAIAFEHVLIQHDLSDSFPSVEFFNADGHPELLDWIVVDANKIAVSTYAASSIPNASWKAIVTGKYTPVAPSQD